MVENTNSAFTAVISRLGELSESELRQLHLIIGVRLGASPFQTSIVRTAGKTSYPKKNKGSAGQKPAKASSTAKRGNPVRKSQWANHPLYSEYHRLKKAVELQSKELKVTFNAVCTDESRQYKVALSQWLEAKGSFRGRKTSIENSSDEGSEAESPPSSSSRQAKPVDRPGENLLGPRPVNTTCVSDQVSATAGKTVVPPTSPAFGDTKADAKEESAGSKPTGSESEK
jgi:hypothetical protein